MAHCYDRLGESKLQGQESKAYLCDYQSENRDQKRPLTSRPAADQKSRANKYQQANCNGCSRNAMQLEPLTSLSAMKATLGCPSGGHATTK
jgi:hypothetical protein